MAAGDLSSELVAAGSALLAETDALDMQAQGAMWIYDYALQDWRYYLVTSLVDSIGRRKTYRMLIDIFSKLNVDRSMTVDDVHLGSPSDTFFMHICGGINVNGGVHHFSDCLIGGVRFDAIVYRMLRAPPTAMEADRIARRFLSRVRARRKEAHA